MTPRDEGIVFDSIKIGLASPEKIQEWSRGEVKKPETINYRTLKPEKDGLFCERIFGPTKDWECHCGKYKRIRYKGVVCDRCGVEVTKSKVRRERMGHIKLAAPVSHIWYFKGIPSRMGLILSMSPRALEKVLYFASYIVTDPGTTELTYKQLLTEKDYREAMEKYGNHFKAAMGAEAIKQLLVDIDLEKESAELKHQLVDTAGQKRIRIIKRLEVIEAFRISKNRPEWMILDAIPVIPPDIRPMVQLDGGRFATSDLNDLYRRVINRNNRLNRLLDLGAPDIIVRNEKRMLQEAVDALIDNGRRGRPVTGPGNRSLKSLSDMLKGKQGRFRQNLLGKRVDYSGRSVIVVGPELKIYQCGLPKEMAIELFKPFVMKKLVEDGLAHNIKSAKRMVERLQTEVWDILEDVIKEHPVMLNRAPTLHRLGIQAFEPVLVEGRAIKLHPLACTAYNADFDGDQMAVHVPLSVEAQAECRFLLLSPNNLLKPSDGAPVTVPTQDMILGMYYLTLEKDGEMGEGKAFKDEKEAMLAYDNKVITLHAKIRVRKTMLVDGKEETRLVNTTVGRVIFNEAIPQNLGYVDRTNPEEMFNYEIEFLVDKKKIGVIINRCINRCGTTETAAVLDKIKTLGYKYSTIGALTVSVSDMEIPKQKKEFLKEAEEQVETITKKFRRGLMTDEERHNKVIEAWNIANDKITTALLEGLGKYNNIYMMANSGARGSNSQIKQLAGMRGLMSNPSGGIIELPIKSNFREGLSVLEYFISAHGARKGLTDTALRTADSGYLTRRLVDVSQDIIIRGWDCHDPQETWVDAPVHFSALLEGHYAAADVTDASTGQVLLTTGTQITSELAQAVEDADVPEVLLRKGSLCEIISGFQVAADLVHPHTGVLLAPEDTTLTPELAETIEQAGVTRVAIWEEALPDKIRNKHASMDIVHPETGDVMLEADAAITHEVAKALVAADFAWVPVWAEAETELVMAPPKESLAKKIAGMKAAAQILHPVTGEVLAEAEDAITPELAQAIEEAGVTRVSVRPEEPSIWVEAVRNDKEIVEHLQERIQGRLAVDSVLHPETGEVLAAAGEIIQKEQAEMIEAAGVARVRIRQDAPGLWVSAFMDGNEVIEGLQDRIRGRWSVLDIRHPETSEILVPADTMISPDQAEAVEKAGVKKVLIRTVLTCRSKIGICSKCYGANMASGRSVRIGESVGIIAAQSIGEPGTQLTMRTFHTGGIAGDDITQGLPRVEELFEARKPKGLAIIAEFAGNITISDTKKKREVIITDPETGETKDYLIPYGSRIKVFDGDSIKAGDEITEGSVNPHDILKIKGLRGVQDYMIQEVQRVYRLQGVEINDKHIEVIVRQMLKRVKIEENGDTEFLPGSLVDWLNYENTNAAVEEEGMEPAKGQRVLLGITKASLATDSFLSAASFQETTRVLTEAAIKGKIDPLIGLKENVIIGKLLPAGTGMSRYRNIDIETDPELAASMAED